MARTHWGPGQVGKHPVRWGHDPVRDGHTLRDRRSCAAHWWQRVPLWQVTLNRPRKGCKNRSGESLVAPETPRGICFSTFIGILESYSPSSCTWSADSSPKTNSTPPNPRRQATEPPLIATRPTFSPRHLPHKTDHRPASLRPKRQRAPGKQVP